MQSVYRTESFFRFNTACRETMSQSAQRVNDSTGSVLRSAFELRQLQSEAIVILQHDMTDRSRKGATDQFAVARFASMTF